MAAKKKAKKRAPIKRAKASTSKAETVNRKALFVEAYISNGGNATQAMITAGYSTKGANAAGARMLADLSIRSEILRRREEAIEAAEKSTHVTIAGVLSELHGLVHSDLRAAFNPVTGALLPPHQWPDAVAKAMASVKVVEMAGGMKVGGEHVPMYTKEVKFWDKNSAIEKAMKHLGMFERDNHQQGDAAVRALLAAVGADAGKFDVRP